jgi:hypothetical protein
MTQQRRTNKEEKKITNHNNNLIKQNEKQFKFFTDNSSSNKNSNNNNGNNNKKAISFKLNLLRIFYRTFFSLLSHLFLSCAQHFSAVYAAKVPLKYNWIVFFVRNQAKFLPKIFAPKQKQPVCNTVRPNGKARASRKYQLLKFLRQCLQTSDIKVKYIFCRLLNIRRSFFYRLMVIEETRKIQESFV